MRDSPYIEAMNAWLTSIKGGDLHEIHKQYVNKIVVLNNILLIFSFPFKDLQIIVH